MGISVWTVPPLPWVDPTPQAPQPLRVEGLLTPLALEPLSPKILAMVLEGMVVTLVVRWELASLRRTCCPRPPVPPQQSPHHHHWGATRAPVTTRTPTCPHRSPPCTIEVAPATPRPRLPSGPTSPPVIHRPTPTPAATTCRSTRPCPHPRKCPNTNSRHRPCWSGTETGTGTETGVQGGIGTVIGTETGSETETQVGAMEALAPAVAPTTTSRRSTPLLPLRRQLNPPPIIPTMATMGTTGSGGPARTGSVAIGATAWARAQGTMATRGTATDRKSVV